MTSNQKIRTISGCQTIEDFDRKYQKIWDAQESVKQEIYDLETKLRQLDDKERELDMDLQALGLREELQEKWETEAQIDAEIQAERRFCSGCD